MKINPSFAILFFIFFTCQVYAALDSNFLTHEIFLREIPGTATPHPLTMTENRWLLISGSLPHIRQINFKSTGGDFYNNKNSIEATRRHTLRYPFSETANTDVKTVELSIS
ncbi:MAG: hypothetical protein ACE5GL_07935 [Calditrichia bacterium]